MSHIDAFPLCWPLGYERTAPHKRHNSPFKQTMDAAQKFLRAELGRLGAKNIIVSSNVPVRKDGGLYADWMNRRIDDTGVAVYFELKGKPTSLCCDQYNRVWENVYALGKAIEAMRAIERYGVSDFISRAFTGFTELPPPPEPVKRSIWDVLGLTDKPATREEVVNAYRAAAKKCHPDNGGTHLQFVELQEAYQKALQFFE